MVGFRCVSSRRLAWVLLLLLLLPAAVPSAARADDKPVTTLEKIVVSSGKQKGTTDVINAAQIRQLQPATLGELFAATPDVSVAGGNRTAAQKVYVRGIEETNLNVTLDGAKQAGNLYAHTGNMLIDPGILKRVDIGAGTGAALAGPGALGGTIRYETKDAEDLLLPDRRFGSMVKFSAGTNGSRVQPSFATYGMPNEYFSYLFYGSKTWARDYKDGAGRDVSDSDNEPLNGLAKLTVRPAEGHQIKVIADYQEDNGFRAYRSNFGVPPSHVDFIAEDQEMSRRTTSLRYSFDPSDNPLINLGLFVYDNKSSLTRLIADRQTSSWLTRGVDIRNRSEFGSLALTYGYDYTWEQSRGELASGRKGTETGQTHGLYVQADYAVTDYLSLQGGLRYDRALLTDLAGNHYDNGRLNPSARIDFEPIDGLTFFASWAEAFRGVRPIEGLTLIHRPGIDRVKTDRTLKGEVARTAEAGVEFERDGWRAGFTGYKTLLENTILNWQGRSLPFARRNAGDVDVTGFTARLGRDWNNWSADLSYAHSDAKQNGQWVSPSDWLRSVAVQGDKVVGRLGYTFIDQNLRLDWTSTMVLPEKNLPASFAAGKLRGYDVHDIALVWTPTPAQEFGLAITNIFDETYLDHATPYYVSGGTSTLYEMGRSIRLSGSLKF
jgi:hemoglobin/transferrin/lactoferrin receptor protein